MFFTLKLIKNVIFNKTENTRVVSFFIYMSSMCVQLFTPFEVPVLEAGLDIRLVDAVARGASRFENLLAPPKTYWPPKKLTGPFPKTKLVWWKKYLRKRTIWTMYN